MTDPMPSLKIAGHIQEDVDGARALAAINRQPAGGPQHSDSVIGPGLPRAVVDRRREREMGRPRGVDGEITVSRRLGNSQIESDRAGARRNAAAAGDLEYTGLTGGEGGAVGATRVSHPTGRDRVEAVRLA